MDHRTLHAYDADAARFAREWNEQAAPVDMYGLLLRHFNPGPTLDVGCGGGRDVAWLAENGFDARGCDASEPLLREARAAHPGLSFERAALPALEGIDRQAFENVLCETVIMHLDPGEIGEAVRNLLGLLRPGGTLYLSWRVTGHESQRDRSGRLYAAFDRRVVLDNLGDAAVLFDAEQASASSGKVVRRLIARRASAQTKKAG